MKPRFSVIVPLYNKAPYVRKALESILTQSYTNYEVVIIDDGSTDNSLAIVNDFVKTVESGKWKVESQTNAGVAAARNNGVAKSKGEYVCFLDADDWWEPNFLEEMDKLIHEYPDAGLYATNYVYYKPGKTHVALKLEVGIMNYPEAYLHSAAMPVWTGAACMPRRVFDEMGGFPVGIKLGEDFLLWAKTALNYKVTFCEKALAYYNNDVPASLRATRNLHEPEYHMLFNLSSIEREIENSDISIQISVQWKALLDKLRVNGLMDYWLSDKYHDAAAAELKKVDWSKQSKNAKAQYEKPIWLQKAKRRFMQIGSYIKQTIVRVLESPKLREFVRFCIIGVVSTLIHYGIYYAIIKGCGIERELWLNVAYTIGYAVSWCCNLWLTAHFTFKTTLSVKRGIGFAVSHGINYLLHLGFLNLFLWMGISATVAPWLVFCCVIPINFILVRTVFKKL